MNLRRASRFCGMVLLLSFLSTLLPVFGADPVVSNVRASQRAWTKLVDIYYDLADADSSSLSVTVAVSTNGGVSYDLPATSFTGALGAGIAPGNNKQITWNAGTDWNGKFSANVRFGVSGGVANVDGNNMQRLSRGSAPDYLGNGSSSHMGVTSGGYYNNRIPAQKGPA